MRILLVVEPMRKDWYQYLKYDVVNDYILLWHESKSDIPEWLYKEKFFQEIYYWDAFLTPAQLLNRVKPDRLVFFEIIDQRQIALLVTANKKSLKTFYLEHGAAGDKENAIKRANEINFFSNSKRHYLVSRFKNGFGKMIKSKLFYYAAVPYLQSLSSFFKFSKLPFSMVFNTPNKSLALTVFPERVPYRSIVFNKPNFEQFQVYTGIQENQAVFSGVPIFDKYFNQNEEYCSHISYIDHPYVEGGNLYGWNKTHHHYIASNLERFVSERKIKLIIKLHPNSDIKLWESYNLNKEFIQIVQDGDFTKELLSSKLILAFSSSMVNGFLCAQKNLVLLGWHPQPGIIGADFSKSGLCHVSFSPSDMYDKYDFWVSHNLSKDNNEQYENFLRVFNYPFDGKASVRVMNAIMEDEVC
jgi:hypothetical protein